MSSIRFSALILVSFVLMISLFQCGGSSPEALFNNGLQAMQEQDPIGASLYFDDFINQYPENEMVRDAYVLLVQCYFSMGDFPSARKVLEEFKQKYQKPEIKVWSDFQIGETYAQEGNIDKALQVYQTIADSTDTPQINFRALSQMGQLYAKQTQRASAEAVFDKIFTLADEKIENPTNSLDYKLHALYGKAEVLEASEEFQKARENYKQALELVAEGTGIVDIDKDRQNSVIQWAHTWSKAGDYVSSATMYDRLLDHPYVQENVKPELIYYKIQSLQRLFNEDGEMDKEEIAFLVNENKRLIDNYSNTERGIAARVEIADLVQDSTPEMSEEYLVEAVDLYRKFVEDESDLQRSIIGRLQIIDSYIRLNKFEEARQEINELKQEHKDIPYAMNEAEKRLYYIRNQEESDSQQEAQQIATPPMISGETDDVTGP